MDCNQHPAASYTTKMYLYWHGMNGMADLQMTKSRQGKRRKSEEEFCMLKLQATNSWGAQLTQILRIKNMDGFGF